MQVLVTGLKGFTGRYLHDALLSEGHQVNGLEADLTDINALKAELANRAFDAVVHLAGISFVQNENINQIYEVNLIGTRNLLEAIYERGLNLKRVMLVSTANVYGNAKAKLLTEQMLAYPANDYAVSKLAMEKMAALWMGKLPIFITRPFNYTGVGQAEHFLIPKIVSHFKQRLPEIELGNIDIEREFGDVRTVSDIYSKMLECDIVGKTVNICTGEAYSLKQVIEMCERITNHSMKIKVNPKFVRPNEVKTLVGSNELLKDVLSQWKTYSFEETLTWMLNA